MKVKACVTKYAYWWFLAGLSALLCGACFTEQMGWVIVGYIVVSAVFFTPEQLIATWIFVYCFDGLLLNFAFIHYYLLTLLAGHYLYRFIEQRRVANWRLLLVAVVFSLYVILRSSAFSYWTVALLFFFWAYVLVSEQREKMAFTNLVKVLAVGLIVSGVLGLLYDVSPYLQKHLERLVAEAGSLTPYAHEYYRFQGLTVCATQYAGLATVAFGGLLLAKYQKRINNYWFYGLFVPVFIFGYQTLTRTFLLCVAVALIIFAIFCFLRDRRAAWRTLLPLAGVLVVVAVVFFTATMGNFERIFHDDAMAGGSDWDLSQFTEDDWVGIKNGDPTKYDYLGRRVLWSLYANDWVSSVTTLLLGQSVTHVWFAGHTPHNWYLFFAWQYGLVGIALFGLLLSLMVNWRGWRTKQFWVRLAPCLMLLVPLLLQGVFDDNGYWAQIGIILMILWCREQPRWRVVTCSR